MDRQKGANVAINSGQYSVIILVQSLCFAGISVNIISQMDM